MVLVNLVVCACKEAEVGLADLAVTDSVGSIQQVNMALQFMGLSPVLTYRRYDSAGEYKER